MQKVFLWSSLTYEWTHVTPSSALVPTTERHASDPLSVIGISSPSGNMRSTMKRAIDNLLRAIAARKAASQVRLGLDQRPAIRRKAQCSAQLLCSFLREPRRDLHPRVEAQLGKDVVHVVVDRALREVQPLGDLAVAQAASKKLGDLVLTPAQGAGNDWLLDCAQRRFGTGGKQAPCPRHARKVARSAFGELESRSHHEVLYRAGHEHISRVGGRHHVRRDVESDATGSSIDEIALPRVHTCANPKAELEKLVPDLDCAPDSAGRAVENSGDSLLAGLDLAARKTCQCLPDDRVVAVDQVVPLPAAKPHRVGACLRDLRAEHGRDHRLGGVTAPSAGEELLDLTEDPVGVQEVEPVVDRV